MEDMMNSADAGSFLKKNWKNEPKVAAYSRYQKLTDFRRFGFHHVVIGWFLIFYHKDAKVPLSLISDVEQIDE